MSTQRLHQKDLASPGDYHAALRSSRIQPRIHLHTQDFFGLRSVPTGTGTHEINGRSDALPIGELILVGPSDRHAISVRAVAP